ncbi:hypothetical protein JCGZ_04542 [Jatropha curcas]|uniref:Leucine-rich repeat-containing N-terminal plant-type domain-containing protein n=1 Tax=Jatropha curcas TaxID=180498 RepID=A0A067LGY2_JATCU|nr:hypothetical protein JCGZ_04542 [Jatropha curcas]
MGGNEIKGFNSYHGLSSLKKLYIRYNQLEGASDFKGSYNFTNLEELYLDFSINVDENFLQSLGAMMPSVKLLSLRSLNGSVPTGGLLNLKNLEYLDLSYSAINNSFGLLGIGMMKHLKTLLLPGCGLTGPIPTDQGLCKLKFLQELDISDNYLNGSLPWCLANLTSLKKFSLYYNNFIGDIASSPLRRLTSLEYLNLFNNLFQIPISLSLFFNHSNLNFLDCQQNTIYAITEAHNFTPKFQLETLLLSGHGYGSGEIPKFLYHQYNLRYVDISNNKIRGEFPFWLLGNNTKLRALNLANNSLSGPFQLPIHSPPNLSFFDISDNSLYGSIPKKIGTHLSRLVDLNMRGNGLNGNIPPSFGNMSFLESLDLSDNRLSGSIPEQLTVGCISLFQLKLSKNTLQGQIFSKNVNLESLRWLQLDGNLFNGNIPNSLFSATSLSILDVSDNHLSGSIPKWMGKMSSLEILDLSLNNISGSLPSNFYPSQIEEIHLSKNKLQGSLSDVFNGDSSLVMLDLSHNNLIGKIPSRIANNSKLRYIQLSSNHLEGGIPTQLCNLYNLSLIDLSHNDLSGPILPCLRLRSDWSKQHEFPIENTTFSPMALPPGSQPLEFTNKNGFYSYQPSTLQYFSGIDLSCNNFSGEIPFEFGDLDIIQMLNLSHNSLTGSIPHTFSNLRQIESLDLSYNNLEGEIPSQITQLYSLEVFSIAHNNLSGKTPTRVAQFGTSDEGSYEGNPFLCGWPLPKACNATITSSPMPINSIDDNSGFIDMDIFYVSFVVSYIIVLLGIIAVLYINPYWRQAWFYYVELISTNCYYFLVDNIPYLFKFGVS